jgi:hypothetical protein
VEVVSTVSKADATMALGQNLDVLAIAPVWKAGKALDMLDYVLATVRLSILQSKTILATFNWYWRSFEHSSAVYFMAGDQLI